LSTREGVSTYSVGSSSLRPDSDRSGITESTGVLNRKLATCLPGVPLRPLRVDDKPARRIVAVGREGRVHARIQQSSPAERALQERRFNVLLWPIVTTGYRSGPRPRPNSLVNTLLFALVAVCCPGPNPCTRAMALTFRFVVCSPAELEYSG
jgi:hypothetical protein